MNKLVRRRFVRLAWVAFSASGLVAPGCSGGSSSSVASSGASSGAAMGSGGSGNADGGGAATGGSGASMSGASSGGGPTSGSSASGAGIPTSGGSGSASSSGGATSGSSGSASSSGGATSGSSGVMGADASVTDTGTSTGGAPTTTPDLIGPGGPTCSAANATHGDGWMCLLSYPTAGTNAVGAWFDYLWAGSTCNLTFKKPAGNSATNPQVCFSSTGCTGAAPGAGLGLSVCDVHGVDVSTWPQMQQLISSHSLSTTGKSVFSSCNTGAKMTGLNWAVGSGSLPAGTSVMFNDAADQVLGQVDTLTAGATSATVPATVDTSKIASIHFSFNAAKIASWDFCLTSLKIAYQ